MKKLFYLMSVLLFITGCQTPEVTKINVDIDPEQISQVKLSSGSINIDIKAPFDSEDCDKINDIMTHIESLTFIESVDDEGTCDGGNDIRYHIFTNQDDHYELYDVTVSQKGKCMSYLAIKKNDTILGYSKTGSNTLYDLFLDLNN